MTNEQKQLLYIDLCGRLPYGVIVHSLGIPHEQKLIGYIPNIDYYNIKPYLRPMSSITEEELRDFAKIKFKNNSLWEIVEFPKKDGFKEFINVKCKNKNNGDTWIFQVNTSTPLETYYGIDWLNEHHFDYRGLIEKGLALEAPEGIYKTE